MTDTAITADELTDLLGELDADATERLLALAPTFDDVVEALAAIEDEASGVGIHVPSSPKLLEVRAVLEELMFDQDDYPSAYEYSVPV
jgi:hypothetical protein